MIRIIAAAIIFAILGWVVSLNVAHAYDCPTNGCYGYSPSQAQDAYNQQQYEQQLQNQNAQTMQMQQELQNQINQLHQEGY